MEILGSPLTLTCPAPLRSFGFLRHEVSRTNLGEIQESTQCRFVGPEHSGLGVWGKTPLAGIVKSTDWNPHSGWLEAVPKGAGEARPSLSICFPHPQTPFPGGRGSRTDPSLPPPSAPHSPAHGPSSDSAPPAFHPSCSPNQSESKFVPPGPRQTGDQQSCPASHTGRKSGISAAKLHPGWLGRGGPLGLEHLITRMQQQL